MFRDEPIKLDFNIIYETLPEIARIINELPGNVKLDLIGGEVSLMNLHLLLETLYKQCGDKLKRINITTNMSQSSEYYNDLTELCYQYNSEIGITCSWHSEFVSLEDFIEKFSKIKSPTNQKGIRIECVSRVNNQDDIKKLIEICEKNGYSYFIERDLTAPIEIRDKLIAQSSSTKKPRYKITYEDGSKKLFMTRNEFITSSYNYTKMSFHSLDYYCTRDYNYVYIEVNEHQGRGCLDECKEFHNIKDFHPIDKPKKCLHKECTLCGQISLSKDINEII
jgi:hypothetical protein